MKRVGGGGGEEDGISCKYEKHALEKQWKHLLQGE